MAVRSGEKIVWRKTGLSTSMSGSVLLGGESWRAPADRYDTICDKSRKSTAPDRRLPLATEVPWKPP
jgi:hypothetical protein